MQGSRNLCIATTHLTKLNGVICREPEVETFSSQGFVVVVGGGGGGGGRDRVSLNEVQSSHNS